MGEPNWSNQTIWTGDNLDIMRGVNSASVDLIYLDPPFNSKHNYAAPIGSKAAGAAFKDTWGLDDVNLAWHGEIKREHPGLYALLTATREIHGDSMMSYLIYMAIRLMEMKRLLNATGSIYLHCDTFASHYLKLLTDAVFGRETFRNEIIWQKIRSSKAQTKGFGSVHDTILLYSKTSAPIWNNLYRPLSKERVARHYGKVESGTRRRYGLYDFTQTGAGSSRCFGNKIIDPPAGKHWIWDQARIDVAMSEGRLVFTSENMVRLKRYLDESRGNPVEDIWVDIPTVNAVAKERHWLSHPEAIGAAETDPPRVQCRGRHDPGPLLWVCHGLHCRSGLAA